MVGAKVELEQRGGKKRKHKDATRDHIKEENKSKTRKGFASHLDSDHQTKDSWVTHKEEKK